MSNKSSDCRLNEVDWIQSHKRAAEEIQLKEHESVRSIDLNTDATDSPESVKIDLLGREYNVTGYGNSKEVQKLAAYISRRAESRPLLPRRSKPRRLNMACRFGNPEEFPILRFRYRI